MTVQELKAAIKAVNTTISINGLLKAELIEIYNDIVEVDTPRSLVDSLRDILPTTSETLHTVTTKRGDFVVDIANGTMMDIKTGIVENYDNKLFEHSNSSNTVFAEWVECDGGFEPVSDTVLVPYCVDGNEGVSKYELGYSDNLELPIVYKIKTMFGGSETYTMALGFTNSLAYVLQNMADDADYAKILALYGLKDAGSGILINRGKGFVLNISEYATCKVITDGRQVAIKPRTKRQF